MQVNIATSDAFLRYKEKSIKLVDKELTIILYIDTNGMPTDDNMIDWQDCMDGSVFWAYNGRGLSDVVYISVIEYASERPYKRRKRLKI